ncbi:MAG: anaerobic ribonucleoside-triphosphate reductase activating protein [Nanoarchaeota archaeon]|nr:anaerobic ribonucleoside-triphosphate reductase activating protein [Nanoarchaeota archaeon]
MMRKRVLKAHQKKKDSGSQCSIRGLKKTSLLDYPRNICAVIFLGGCNYKCPFCHNPSIVADEGEKISRKEVIDFLKKRKGLLDGVCVSGGEPTIHKTLPNLLKTIKKLGMLVKLDTNGSNPVMLEKIIKENLVDYVAMDIKTSLSRYKEVSGKADNVRKSINILMNSGIDYEFRTTMVPGFVSNTDFVEICNMLKGAKRFCIQQFNPKQELIDASCRQRIPYTEQELEIFLNNAKPFFQHCELRNL